MPLEVDAMTYGPRGVFRWGQGGLEPPRGE